MCDHCGCRSFGPIAELTAEHEEILRLAWDLAEAHRNRVPGGEGLAAELLARLDVHNVSEEGGLYRLLLEVSDFSVEQCDRLETEHRDLRATILAGGFGRRDYLALAAHIEEEEMELFPQAMFGFDDEEWDAMDGAHRAASAGALGQVPV